ncbi:MAG: peptidoglycan-associated lipoprotein Pal [Candidatus Rokubacteria bacterium]|nr:peptidoglycan-associated lipoprotein Pal [Candidatus Rokubacteria bacterium]
MASAPPGSVPGAQVSPREFVEAISLKDIHFDYDRYDIKSSDGKVLEENAKWLKSNARTLVLVEGHADERGTNEYNLALGERRAKATRDYLMSLGVEGARISIISYGEERPTCKEGNELCWSKNRRAHFLTRP